MQVLIHDNSQMIVIRTRRGKKNQLSSVYELVPQIEAEKKMKCEMSTWLIMGDEYWDILKIVIQVKNQIKKRSGLWSVGSKKRPNQQSNCLSH